LIPILCLFLFGGAVLRDFSLAIIVVGVFSTYSSIFIASPIVLWWTRARGAGAMASLAGNHQKSDHNKSDRPLEAAVRLMRMLNVRSGVALISRTVR
jgi:hypothetical protein